MASAPPHSDENRELEIKDSFLAPWGLPKEELPMHVLWRGSTDEISVEIPSEVEVVEVHNMGSISSDDATERENLRFEEDELATEGYFGLVLRDDNQYEESAKEHSIKIQFIQNGEPQITLEKSTHIIRPKIRVRNAPSKIHLTDDNIPDNIEIDMEYIGFGMAQVEVDAQAEGEFVSEGKSMLHDLLQAILETGIHKQDVDSMGPIPDDWKNDSDIEVPQEEKEELVRDMMDIARSDDLSEEYDSEELMEVANALEKAEGKTDADSGFAAVLYRFIETALLSSILNVVDRHPTENVSLDNPTTKIRTKARTTELEINIHLRDSLDNEYPGKTVEIDVTDEREEEAGVFESEIVTNWENYQIDPDEVFSDD